MCHLTLSGGAKTGVPQAPVTTALLLSRLWLSPKSATCNQNQHAGSCKLVGKKFSLTLDQEFIWTGCGDALDKPCSLQKQLSRVWERESTKRVVYLYSLDTRATRTHTSCLCASSCIACDMLSFEPACVCWPPCMTLTSNLIWQKNIFQKTSSDLLKKQQLFAAILF